MEMPPPPNPPVLGTPAPCASTPLARGPLAPGTAPGWTLADCGSHLLLEIAGVMPIRITGAKWRATPAGRILAGVDPAGRTISLRVEHGVCRGAAGMPAILSLAGQSLPGCLLDRGERPYG